MTSVAGAGLLLPLVPDPLQGLARQERADAVGSRPVLETLDEAFLAAVREEVLEVPLRLP